MHRWILGAALWPVLALASETASPGLPSPLRCPGVGAPVVERFTRADCLECWSAPAPSGTSRTPDSSKTWQFDWVVPTAAGADAPMSAAAPVESGERWARRFGGGGGGGGGGARAGAGAGAGKAAMSTPSQIQRDILPRPSSVSLSVQSGPAWKGYLGLQFSARGRVPDGATGWLALVEYLPAGTDGSEQARELVRAVAGPLPLAALSPSRTMTHLGALRWPESARPERLRARAWIESNSGALLAVAADRCGP